MARRFPSLWSLPVAVLAIAAPTSASAETVKDLYRRLEAGGDPAKQAAFQLFRRGDQDDRLRQLLDVGDDPAPSKAGSRQCILEALTYGWLAAGEDPTRPEAACILAYEALDDPVPEVARLAVQTLSNVDVPTTYRFLGERLRELAFASLETRRGRQAVGLVEALGRMRDPQKATEVLVGVLDSRLGPELESLVRDALERMTAHRFRGGKQWVQWAASVHDLTLEEWRQGVELRRAERLRSYELATEEIFMSLLAALRDQPERLLEELRKGLEQTTNRAVRKRAVLELGRMGRVEGGEEPLRERAVALLRSQLPAQGEASPYFDEIQALVLLNLGKTGDVTLLPDISRFLGVTSSRMRAAAARALGTLGAEGAIGPLLNELSQAQAQAERDPFLIEAILEALGRIGHNANQDGERVSTALVTFCRGLLGANGAAGPGAAEHLARAAEALGNLTYGEAEERGRVVQLLLELAVHPDPKVRFAAVNALGPIPSGEGFALLRTRLSEEGEQWIRRAILDAIGLQAASSSEVNLEAIDILVPFLFDDGDEKGLRRRSFDAVKRLVGQGDLRVLKQLADAMLRNRDRAVALRVALPFLRQLPALDSVPLEDAEAREQLVELMAMRAWALVPSEPDRALADFEAVLNARGLHTVGPESRELFLGKGRAKLGLSLTGEAFAIGKECLESLGEEPDPAALTAVWTLLLEAMEATKAQRPEAVPGLLQQLEPLQTTVPIPLARRFAALKAPQ
jgi:HEAT repeat protein